MARLIPRKQIEEQQNITGSLEIGQDIIVGGNSIVAGNSVISGSLEVLQDFFLGDNLSDRGEVTGSVFLTGSLEIDGQLIFAGPEAVLSATASNALLAQDTLRYEGLRAKDFGANVPTLYVSSTDGDDTNDGRTIQFPLRTIKRAAQLAQPGYDGRYGFDTGSVFNGYVIKVQAGTYLEDNPVILPSNTTIWGSGLRITKVNAKNPEQDLFWVNSGCYIAEITMGGLRLWPNEKEPQRGFGVAFQPGAFITTSPYVQNCSQISNQENSFTELYEDIPPGGGGLYVNGDAVDPDSPLASMVLDAYTQISPNGVGCLVNGRGFIQLVSFFTNFSYYAIRVNNGGHATLNNSNISFGLYGMYASGSRFISGSGGNTEARDKVRASYSVIVDVLNKGLEDGLPSVTTKNTAAGIRATSVSEYPQYQLSAEVDIDTNRASEIVADFELVSQIVDSGTSDYPTLIAKSSTKGYGANSPYNILGTPQITSSVSATSSDLEAISSSYGAILDIFNDGTASYQFVSNTSASIKVTDTEVNVLSPAADYSSSLLISSSFVTIYNIIEGGVGVVPTLVSNNSASIKTGDVAQFTTGVSSSLSVRNSVSASFSIVYNILANGTGSSILDIPENHQRTFTVRKSSDNTSYVFGITGSAGNGDVENASLTLFRGETYRFFVSAGLGTEAEPFFIRKSATSGFDYQQIYDYNEGVINNGDSNGVITFQVPYDAPNKLYYISQDTPSFVGEISIYNSSTTPRELIANTLTYPATLASSSVASTDVDKINGYDLLINNIPFIQEEVIDFVSSSWSDFAYNEASCSRDVAFIVNGVAYDLLYGGNEESIRSGLFYYQFPSEATTTQLGPTLTAVKYAAGMAQKLLENRTFVDYDTDKKQIADSIQNNKLFVQNETIAYLSSSWSGFPYNETKCKRDVGYILDAVATDLVYGGNERAIDAGVYYYLYPSLATVSNTTTGQLQQTLDGIKYAAGTTLNIINSSSFVTQSESRLTAAQLLIDNKSLIQDETIQYINVQYPTLDYNTSKCRRDVGYILDAVATDLIYGGNESSTRAGRFYYLYPSVATSTQRRETRDGFLYSKVIGESIVQNIILDTPRIITNDERLIKVTDLTNVTSSISGTDVESSAISSSFAIIEQIIRRGVGSINSAIAQNSGLNWSIDNPLSVTTGSQTTSSYVEPSELQTIKEGFERVNTIIEGGVSAIPTLTASVDGLVKVTNGTQTVGSTISSDLTSSISSSFGYVVRVITGGTGSLEDIVLNTSASIKVTSTSQWVSSNIGTNSQTASISSSFGSVIDIITNGLSVLPTLVQNTTAGITTTGTSQFTGSLSGSLEDIQFISASVSKVTQIIETGNVDLFGKDTYSTPSTTPSTLAAYEIIRENLTFIKNETIAYLSSSWSTFDYDEDKCKRDVGLIISGAVEDLIWNANSASIVNGQFYYEFPSQATGNQLAQTLDGINYASRLAQKLIQNVVFTLPTTEVSASNALLFNNKEFIQNETIAYLSSSWGGFDYNETTCKRDVGYIIDAVRTDLVYGGNERSRVAGEYYFLYPSAATGSQLLQTTDGILYASRLAQSIVSGSVFVSADSDKVEASRLLRENKSLIANEVVEYVSSSWSGVFYNEDKCKRDVGYIIDAVRTDLVYGGNERSTIAGDFYFRFPSAATVAGVPTSTAQLDPTVTGVEYANRLSQKVILSEVLSQPSQSITDAAELIRASRDFIQQNTIDFVYEKYPNFTYDVARCRRDTGFIVDAVVTDLVYGGNERTSTAGEFYYRYPSQATDAQVEETVAAINYAKELTKLIAVDKRALEETFDSVDKVILSGSAGVSSIQLVENTEKGIVVTNSKRVSQPNSATDSDTQIVSASFGNVINIINNGTGSIPTQIRNTERGINRIGGTQITSSLSVDTTDKNNISSSFDIVLDVVENGLGSLPTLTRNSAGGIKVTSTPQYVSASSATFAEATLISASIAIVADIVTNGTSSILTSLSTGSYTTATTDNNKYIAGNILKQNISFIQDETIAYLSSSWSTASYDEAKCRRDVGLILSASAEDLIWNSNSASVVAGKFYYDYPSQAQGAQLNQTLDGIRYAGELAQKVVVGTTLVSPSTSKLTAYNLLLDNKRWIQNQTIALINSNLITQSYNETTCRRDVGYIVDAVATDLLYGGNQRSSDAGRFYYLYPSQATGSQLDQTLEGIGHAKTLSVRIVNNELIYPQYTSSITPAQSEQTKVGTGFDIVLDIIENGTGSLPTLVTNASGLISRTDSVQYQTTASIANTLITSSNNSFDIVLDIVKEGTGSLPTLVKNAAGLLKVTNSTPYYSGIVISGSRVNGITGSFDTIISILEGGIGSIPTIYKNTVSNIRTTGAQQYISASSATQAESTLISASISIVTDIIANGTGSIITALPTSSYTSTLDEDAKWIAYGILKENIGFIQDETIAYLSSSWSTASYIEEKCRRDVGLIVSGAAEDLLFGSVSASVVNGKFYYEYPSQAQGAQLNQTLDGIFYASELAQKLVQNVVFNLPSSQSNAAYDLVVFNKPFIQDEVIAYISSSWSTHIYSESVCRRDVGYILDAVATDIKWGGNQRSAKAGEFYYLYPSEATGSQIQETVTGIKHAKNLVEQILRGRQFTQVPHNRLEAKELIFNNKEFIQNEVIEYVSASWNGFEYVEETCKRDVGFILDAVTTDLVYGGNERSLEAGEFYFRYPSTATSTQLGPTLSGIRHAKNMVDEILQGNTFTTASVSQIQAYNLLLQNKELIQNETIAYVESAWSFFEYNEGKCRRDTGYIVDAVATDILYGGNERVREAGEYYYLYPSLATVNNNTTGQLDETLDGVRYAKGISQKIVANTLLQSPTTSERAGYELLLDNKELIQNETIAFLSSSWSGVDGFSYNEAKCRRDVAYIVDAVATDLIYGGNERSSKAGEYYFLYPSAATVAGYANPAAQLDQTTTGIKFASGIAQKLVQNTSLVAPSYEVESTKQLLRNNIRFIQNETIEYVDSFYPSLVYNREKCRRDVGYILDAVITDMVYGGNERGIVAGDYYYRFPSLATGRTQVRETVDAVRYARELSKLIAQNVDLESPTFVKNIDGNIKATETTQYTSSVSATTEEVGNISASFEIVTGIIQNGIETLPIVTSNVEGLIKVNDIAQITSSVSGGKYEADLVSSSFKLIRDIIYNGSTSIPDSLVSNYEYGFENENPIVYHITTITQSLGDGSQNVTSLTGSVSSSYGNVKNIIANGLDSIPTLVANTSSSLKVSGVTEVSTGFSGSQTEINKVGNLFGIVLDVIENGTSVIPTILPNNTGSIKVTNTPQFLSGSADRLQGKIVSSSIALVIDTLLNDGTSSIQYKAPVATPNTNQKITLAYDLLINNIPFIQAETIQFMSSSWSGFEYNEEKCSRDVGLIVSGAAFDLLYGGNSASFVNGRFYFDYPSAATGSQLDQTITAIRYASGMAERIIRGDVFTSITSSQLEPVSASWDLLRRNKEFIQSESIAYISSSWSEFEYNETTCKRDIGYIIDAVATDILYGGNERSIVAGDYYYRYPSNATTSELEPTLTGVRYARGLAMNIVSGSIFQTASAAVDYAYNTIKDNKLFIQSESVAFVNARFPHLVYNEESCKRDVGYIVDAVITDLKWGGNERANKAGEFYYLYPSEATGVQVEETTAAVNYARLLTEQIMLNNLIAEPQPIQNTSASIKVTNTPQYITGSEVGTSAEANLISQSISILERILEDGTGSIELTLPLSTGSYSTPSTNVNVVYAYNLIQQNLQFIKDETIAYMSSSWSTFPYNEASCSRDVGLIVSGAAEDMLFGSLSASLVNAKFYYEYPSQATGSQLQQTLDGIRYAKRITQKVLQNVEFVNASSEVSASYHLLRDNLGFIQSESIAFISSSWDTFAYNQDTCKRDIGYIVDAVSTDLLYGGNERSVIAGDYYYRYPSNATTSEKDPTATGVEYAGGLSTKLIQNEVFVTASSDSLAIRQLIRDNRPFIQDETMAYLTASWSTFDYDKVKCRRDVGYIVDAVATDLLYGGNERSVTAGKFYYLYPSLATVAGTTNGQLEETLDGIRYASSVTQKVVQNTLFVTASAEVSASFDLLRKNKPFIQAETIAYVSSSWSGVYYNEASCSRDVGFLIDAAATDLLYGGQERSVTAGSFYYLFPSRATNAGVPSEQNQLDPTVTGIRYAGRLSSKVVQNPTYQAPSASVYTALDLLLNNKTLIQKETITFLSSSWSTLQYNEVSCSRDLGFIIDAVATDLIYGGNERSIEAGSIYYRIPSVAIAESYTDNGEVGQKKQTVDGINFAKGITEKIVNNVVLTPPTTRTREAAQRLLSAKETLKQQAIGYTNGAFPYLVYNEASCSRDTGLIVDALVTDLIYGGNERGIAAASSYYNGQYGSAAAVVNDQRTETLETNRYLRTRAEFIAAGAPLENFGSLIVATGIDYSYNGAGVTFKALPPNQGGSGVADPTFEITELGGGRIFFTSGNQDGDFRIGTGLSINQATGTLVGRTFSKSLFSLVTPFSLALEG